MLRLLTEVKPHKVPHHDESVQSEQQDQAKRGGQSRPEDGSNEACKAVIEEQEEMEPVEQPPAGGVAEWSGSVGIPPVPVSDWNELPGFSTLTKEDILARECLCEVDQPDHNKRDTGLHTASCMHTSLLPSSHSHNDKESVDGVGSEVFKSKPQNSDSNTKNCCQDCVHHPGCSWDEIKRAHTVTTATNRR